MGVKVRERKTHTIPQQPITTYPVTANNNYHGLRIINCWAINNLLRKENDYV